MYDCENGSNSVTSKAAVSLVPMLTLVLMLTLMPMLTLTVVLQPMCHAHGATFA